MVLYLIYFPEKSLKHQRRGDKLCEAFIATRWCAHRTLTILRAMSENTSRGFTRQLLGEANMESKTFTELCFSCCDAGEEVEAHLARQLVSRHISVLPLRAPGAHWVVFLPILIFHVNATTLLTFRFESFEYDLNIIGMRIAFKSRSWLCTR